MLLAQAPSVDCGVGDRSANDRMFHGGEKLPEMIILGYLEAILVPIHFGCHRVGDVVGIRRT